MSNDVNDESDPPIGALIAYGAYGAKTEDGFVITLSGIDNNEHRCVYVYLGRILRRDIDYHVLWPLDEEERNWRQSTYMRPWYQTPSLMRWELIAGIDEEE